MDASTSSCDLTTEAERQYNKKKAFSYLSKFKTYVLCRYSRILQSLCRWYCWVNFKPILFGQDNTFLVEDLRTEQARIDQGKPGQAS